MAEELFARDGFERTSMRGVARAAGVDPALVHHYFDNKPNLLMSVLQMSFDPRGLIPLITAGGTNQLGLRIATTALRVWDSPIGQQTVRAVRVHPQLMPSIAQLMKLTITDAAMANLGMSRREAELRTALMEAQMLGLIQVRYFAALEPVASMDRDRLAAIWAPLIDHVIKAELPR